jgi:protein-S-isoprenylcysteine O-methyltransferase Ste14
MSINASVRSQAIRRRKSFHIPFEEANKGRQFGASYDDYVKRVRRCV